MEDEQNIIQMTQVLKTKLMIVGPPEKGKTCLANRLVFDQFSTPGITLGMDIYDDWIYNSVTFKVFDFGGLPIAYQTNITFFDSNSIFLLVFNSNQKTKEEMKADINQHMQNIVNFAPGAPVILVSTYGDVFYRLPDDLIESIYTAYESVVGHYFIDSKSGNGIDKLKNKIVEVSLQQPYVTQYFPKKYLLIEEQIKSMGDNIFSITHDEYKNFLKSININYEKYGKKILSLMHQWGTVHILPKEDIILQPYKLVDMLNCLFFHRYSKRDSDLNDGIIKYDNLNIILNKYNEDIYIYFLNILYDIKIAYPLYDGISICKIPTMTDVLSGGPDEIILKRGLLYDEKSIEINIIFNNISFLFFPMLQIKLKSMVERCEMGLNYMVLYAISKEENKISSTFIFYNYKTGEIQIRYQFDNNYAAYISLMNIRMLINERFKTFNIIDLNVKCLGSWFRFHNILKKLRNNINIVRASDSDDDNISVELSLSLFSILFKEFDLTNKYSGVEDLL